MNIEFTNMVIEDVADRYYQHNEEQGEDFHILTNEEIRLLVISMISNYTMLEMVEKIIKISEDNSLYLQNK